MISIYVYVLDTMADWEIGYVTAELHSRRFFKADAPEVTVRTAGVSKEPVRTMGGLTVVPDCAVGDIVADTSSVLLLPGANTWDDPKHGAAVKKAAELLGVGGTVCAICGATVALARAGLFEHRRHTSNGAGFLEMVCPGYKGNDCYVDEPSVADGNLITPISACSAPTRWTHGMRIFPRATRVISSHSCRHCRAHRAMCEIRRCRKMTLKLTAI